MLPLVEIDINPVIARLGPLSLRWYSLLIMAGVIVGVWGAARFAAQRGIEPDDVYSAAFWIVGAGIVGARVAHVIDRWDYYAQHPLQIPAIYTGGIAIWGALVGGGLAGWIFTRRYDIPFWKFADSVAHGALLGQAVGRLGCIVNGDAAGKPTDGTWGFVYTNPAVVETLAKAEYFNTPTIPYPLFELVLDLALFGLLFLVWRRARFDGAVFLAYCAGYAIIRFLLTFTREEAQFFLGLQQAQVISLVILVVAAYLFLYRRSRPAASRRIRPSAAGA